MTLRHRHLQVRGGHRAGLADCLWEAGYRARLRTGPVPGAEHAQGASIWVLPLRCVFLLSIPKVEITLRALSSPLPLFADNMNCIEIFTFHLCSFPSVI